MAKDQLDDLLGALRAAPADGALDGLEAGVWARVEDARRAQAGSGLGVQVAAAIAALMLGALVGEAMTGHRPTRSEMVVLSEDAGLAPSVAVEGGA